MKRQFPKRLKIRNIIILFILLLISSCKDEEKYNFIYNVLKNPDSILVYLKKSSFTYGNNQYSKGFLSIINQQIILIKKHQEEFLKADFEIYEDRIYMLHNVINYKEIITGPYHIIKLIGKQGTVIKFLWIKNGEKWEFIGLDRVDGIPF